MGLTVMGKIIIWILIEIIFNVVGIDDLIDYAEFLFGKHLKHLEVYTATIVLVSNFDTPTLKHVGFLVHGDCLP
jgi:hypothetical protein